MTGQHLVMAAAVAAFIGGPIVSAIGYDGLAVVAAVAMVPVCLLIVAASRNGSGA